MNNYYNKDYYKDLELEPFASEDDIKSSFRRLARKYHPDVNKDSISVEKFKRIKEAYEVLNNQQEKGMYDRIKGYSQRRNSSSRAQQKKAYSSTSNAQKTTYTPPPSAQKAKNQEQKEGFSKVLNDIFDGIFETGSKDSFSKEKKKRPKTENGSDITMKVKISYSESINGTNRKVNILHTEKCPNCNGNRFINGAVCPICKGSGETSLHKKLNVRIPANVVNDSKIRIANEGTKGSNGGRNGDLYLTIEVENNAFFKFDGNNVSCEIPITPFEAALGTTIEVPTLEGKVSMKIPPLTSSGQKFRLAQEGMLDQKSKIKGDQVVIIKIEMPKSLTIEEIQLYEKLKLLSREDVRKSMKNAT